MSEFFSGSFDDLHRYWKDESRARKFTKGGTRTKAVRFLLDKAEVEIHKGVWIDTAIGAGFVQSQLYNTVQPNFLIGIDFSRAMLDLVDEPTERILASAFSLPIRSRVANLATNIFCLSDYPDPGEALSELARITKNRGIVMYLDYSDDDGYWKIRRENHDPDTIIGNIHLRNPDSIINYLPSGMRIVQNILIEYEVESDEFDNRLKLPQKLKRVFLFVELYKPRLD